MSKDSDIQNLIAQIKTMRPGWGTTKLRRILASGTQAEQDAALQAVQTLVQGGSLASMGDVENAAQQAAQDLSDPVSKLKNAAKVGLFPWDTHTAWSDQQLQQLRAYFKGDPLLKNDPNAQSQIVDQLSKTAGSGDPVQAAKGIHWGMLSPDQKVKYGYQSGDIRNLDQLKKQVDENVDWSGMDKYINSLSGDKKYAALQQINQAIGSDKYINQGKVDQALQQVTAQPSAQAAATTTGAVSQAQPAPTTGMATLSALTPQPGATDVTDQQKQLYKLATGGQDFDTAYNNYANNNAISIQQQNAITGAATGDGSLWTSGAYQPVAQGYVYGSKPLSQVSGDTSKYKVSPAQFLGMQATTSLKLATTIETAAAAQWAQTYQGTIPDQLIQQIYQNVSKMPPGQQAQLALNPQGAEASGGALDIGAMMSSYASAHPEAVSAGAGSDTTTYALNQDRAPSPIPGVSMGLYTSAVTNMKTLWASTFHREPSDKEIRYFAGWNKDAVQAWVDQQPSIDNPTMTVGERAGYLANADAASQKLWGTPADSRMADLLDGHFNPKTPASTTPKSVTTAINQSLAQTSPGTSP